MSSSQRHTALVYGASVIKITTCLLVYFLLRLFPMRMVVESINRPAVLVRIVH